MFVADIPVTYFVICCLTFMLALYHYYMKNSQFFCRLSVHSVACFLFYAEPFILIILYPFLVFFSIYVLLVLLTNHTFQYLEIFCLYFPNNIGIGYFIIWENCPFFSVNQITEFRLSVFPALRESKLGMNTVTETTVIYM